MEQKDFIWQKRLPFSTRFLSLNAFTFLEKCIPTSRWECGKSAWTIRNVLCFRFTIRAVPTATPLKKSISTKASKNCALPGLRNACKKTVATRRKWNMRKRGSSPGKWSMSPSVKIKRWMKFSAEREWKSLRNLCAAKSLRAGLSSRAT